jgi:hypothetical protein
MGIYALAVSAAAWVVVLTSVAFEHLRTRPLSARRRILLYGLLLTTTSSSASFFVEIVGWPHSQRGITHLVLVLVATAGLAMVIRGGTNWGRRNHSRQRSPEL